MTEKLQIVFAAEHFYQRCINMISETLKSNMKYTDHSSQRAALLFLRGLYHLAEENLVEGLKDLTATAKEDARFYPEKFVICESVDVNTGHAVKIWFQ